MLLKIFQMFNFGFKYSMALIVGVFKASFIEQLVFNVCIIPTARLLLEPFSSRLSHRTEQNTCNRNAVKTLLF
jgi:hypothetical protein